MSEWYPCWFCEFALEIDTCLIKCMAIDQIGYCPKKQKRDEPEESEREAE